MTDNTISFVANRKHYSVFINDILYVLMKKQDAYVHLSDGSVLKTRKTFAEFQQELGDDFIRIRRGSLVSVMAIHSINKFVNLSNGESLEYSPQHRKEIMEKFRHKQRNLIVGLADNDNPENNNDYQE